MVLDLQCFPLVDTIPVYLSSPVLPQTFLNIELNLSVLYGLLGSEPLEVDSQLVLFAGFEHVEDVWHLVWCRLLVV